MVDIGVKVTPLIQLLAHCLLIVGLGVNGYLRPWAVNYLRRFYLQLVIKSFLLVLDLVVEVVESFACELGRVRSNLRHGPF